MGLLEKMGVWYLERPGRDEAWVQLEGFDRTLEHATLPQHPEAVRNLAQALLRTGSRGNVEWGSATAYERLDLRALARSSGLELARVREGLRFFRDRRHIGPVVDEDSFLMNLQAPRSSRPDLGAVRIARLRKRAEERARQVVAYAGLRDCRRRMLRTYFGESAPARCGNCDNCR
jgi:ATP-dependent DNA helicase RecQ